MLHIEFLELSFCEVTGCDCSWVKKWISWSAFLGFILLLKGSQPRASRLKHSYMWQHLIHVGMPWPCVVGQMAMFETSEAISVNWNLRNVFGQKEIWPAACITCVWRINCAFDRPHMVMAYQREAWTWTRPRKCQSCLFIAIMKNQGIKRPHRNLFAYQPFTSFRLFFVSYRGSKFSRQHIHNSCG